MAGDAVERRALAELKAALKDIWQDGFTDAYLLRWLRARDFDVAKAEDLLRKNLRWREENQVDTLVERYECHPVLKKYFPGGIFNHDREGSPVYIVPIGNGMLQCLPKEQLVRHVVCIMEQLQRERDRQSRKLGKVLDSSIFLVDYENFSLKQVYSLQVFDYIRAMLALYENNYPETLKLGILINNGWKKMLFEHVDPSQLPAHWGGTIVDPQGGPRCTHMIGPGGELPEAVGRGGGVLAADPEATTCFLERGRRLEVPVQVDVAGSELRWQLMAKDVHFSLWRTEGDKNRVELIAPAGLSATTSRSAGRCPAKSPEPVGTFSYSQGIFLWGRRDVARAHAPSNKLSPKNRNKH
ncbi:hypothetical protein HPB48_005869 [Haemaphysalis longicornis]|uniref:CRAL-TRIO domain-containing protein n=1 Tax=Haemaphysalis longicornis TaxID=44386 RepID=A0A9J6GN07_HAELO|nr:hypothetical protein HPB48_005869 [Haemaphysalis longicornis]